MAKDRTSNPVTAHAKAQKKAEHRKTKANVAKQRSERLAKRDPSRVEKKIEELKELERHGSLRAKDRETLKGLERDLGMIRRARGGDDERDGGTRGGDMSGEGRGKRDNRDGSRVKREDSEETEPEVRGIPWPRDTPPPIPRQKRRDGPTGAAEEVKKKEEEVMPQVTYSSAPVMRDLRKEATGAKFAPSVVRRNVELAKGKGGLVEEEEWERLEKAGYAGKREESKPGEGMMKQESAPENGPETGAKGVQMEEVEDEDI